MRIAHFDASAGLSGDMILAAFLDLGGNEEDFRRTIQSLGLEVRLEISEVYRASLRAKRVEVVIPEGKKIKPRRWSDIEALITGSNLSRSVKDKALAIFKALFEAEGRVHGLPPEKIHLHEVGADDALVDVLGTCWLVEKLGIERITCSPINLGAGWVKTSHGHLPVPPPAVAELLKGIPMFSAWAEEELTTPTGAAIISSLTDEFLPFPEIRVNRIGYGAGGRDLAHIPNILRLFLGEGPQPKAATPLYEIRANIDDTTPQVLAQASELALEAGALDVFQTPVVMKKGRLATQLTLLAEADKIDKIINILFRETSTIGIRYHAVERRILERREEKIQVFGEDISLKLAFFGGQEVHAQPEFEDCRRVAIKTGQPLKYIQELAIAAWRKKQRNK